MPTNNSPQQSQLAVNESRIQSVSRRKFLLFAGASAGVMAIAASCNKNDDDNNMNSGVDLGKDDIGILNYAYALEQLEAAFYTQVILDTIFRDDRWRKSIAL